MMRWCFVLVLLLCGYSAVAFNTDEQNLPRWDYWLPLVSSPQFSGTFLASRPNQIHQIKQQFQAINIFALTAHQPHENALYYGSVLLQPEFPSVDDPAVQAATQYAISSIKQTHGTVPPQIRLKHAVLLPLHVTGDNGVSQMVVVQHFRDGNGQLQRMKSHVTFGFNFYLTLEDEQFNLEHQIVVNLDREHAYNLFQHTFQPLSKDTTETTCSAEGHYPDEKIHPRILTYNVWNTNPSADVYGRHRRWAQYEKRMDHLAQFVRESRADIIGFQEVRYDGTFGAPGQHAQIQHLVDRLPGYQYIYQGAMSYINNQDPYERIEEGPAILSKYPIVSTDYLLLSRDPNDPNDAHQRLCLHAVIDVPEWGLVDVYTTHLSLSERSREQTMIEIWEFMQQGRGATQVLLGDLNAEPQSQGIQFLQGLAPLHEKHTDLRDAWLQVHDEAPPRSMNAVDRFKRFTFPSDNPSKRIDFILYRGKGRVNECEIIGQDATSDTAQFPTDVGMLHPHSPVYASDHRGVVVEFSP